MNELFRQLIECDRDSLVDFVLETSLKASDEETKLVLLYARIMTAYYQADNLQLEKYIKKLEEIKSFSKLHELILEIAKVRLEIRKMQVHENSINVLKLLSADFPEWKGEILFVCSFAYSRINNHYMARETYLESYNAFKNSNFQKKSLLALQNHIAQDSLINPDKRRIAEYENVLNKARKIKAKDIEGLVLMNLSNEYEEVGAMKMSLDYAFKAVSALETHKQTYQHASALCHVCRLLYESNRFDEGDKFYNQVKAYNLPEISANIELLEKLRAQSKELKSDNPNILPWVESDFKDYSKRLKLGKLGEKLIMFLAESPKTKEEIVLHLYGDRIEFTNLENRFNVLLSRIRKKHENLIYLQADGKYSLKPVGDDFLNKVS